MTPYDIQACRNLSADLCRGALSDLSSSNEDKRASAEAWLTTSALAAMTLAKMGIFDIPQLVEKMKEQRSNIPTRRTGNRFTKASYDR